MSIKGKPVVINLSLNIGKCIRIELVKKRYTLLFLFILLNSSTKYNRSLIDYNEQ